MLTLAEIPAIYLLVAGIALLSIGYFLGEVIQSIEDGLFLMAMRFIGFLVITYLFLRVFFGLTPF